MAHSLMRTVVGSLLASGILVLAGPVVAQTQPAPTQPAPTQPAPVKPAPAKPAEEGQDPEGQAATDDAASVESEGAASSGDAQEGEGAGSEGEEGATEPSAPDAQPEEAPEKHEPPGSHSASANQGTEIPPEDDYAGASDEALVEPPASPKDLILGVGLDLTLPLGSASNYVASASIQGLSLDLRYYFWDKIGLGASIAFDSVSKKTEGTVVWDEITVTAVQVREITITPITLKAYYAWRDAERFVPYVALGAGVARTNRRLIVGFTSLADPHWQFVAAPEVGLHIPAGPTLLQTNVRLSYLPASGSAEEQAFAHFTFGLAIQ